MPIDLEHHEIIFGDGCTVRRSLNLPEDIIVPFLERFFQHLFHVDENRNCHRCTDACRCAMTMHVGRPFFRRFDRCVPA